MDPSADRDGTEPGIPWDDIDERAVAYLRALAADAVQRAGNGHPGTAMALAPVAYLLFQRTMRHDPADPEWIGRDRFVLSAGHSSMTLYSQLFLSGYGLTMADLEAFRTWQSATPGHPEYRHTRGVEMTTGPLGQGVSTAVGMAMAARYDRGLLDPDATHSPFDHHIWVIASDGDLQEGISAEASSLAGTQRLGGLCVLWDDNRISIEGDTAVAFTEDVLARYRAYGWRTLSVDARADGSVDIASLWHSLRQAAEERSQPVLIRVQTVIAWPAPNARGTAKSHGSALGDAEIAATKDLLGLDPTQTFAFDPEVLASVRQRLEARVAVERSAWQRDFLAWREANPVRAALLDRLRAQVPPDGLATAFPEFPEGGSVSTRKASGQAINAIARVMPELWGGSADLAESNDTTIIGGGDFLPAGSPVLGADPYGRVIHFGIREHAMGAILNGIALDGLTRPFGGTFLVFSDYMRPAVRLASLMTLPVIYVWSHDSIGLGEDGPTHQPIEHLWALRAIPGLSIVRPADAHETAAAWHAALARRGPVGLILTRQNVPVLQPVRVDVLMRGAYVAAHETSALQVILMATGSEVHLALEAYARLSGAGIGCRVVSMPCLEWFDEQPEEYRTAIIPPNVRARVAVEAGSPLGWWKYVGDSGRVVGIDRFGASADGSELFERFGITVEAIVGAARSTLEGSVG